MTSYNRIASAWTKSGLSSFKNSTFFLSSSMSKMEAFHLTSRGPYNCYPAQDQCKLPGDPHSGCVYSESAWFHSQVVVLHDHIEYQLYDGSSSFIGSFSYNKSITIRKSPVEIGCSSDVSLFPWRLTSRFECPSLCREDHGVWNRRENECVIVKYLTQVCHRLRQNGTEYVLDPYLWALLYRCYRSASALPENPQGFPFPSDYSGCVYNNNWNSAVYDSHTPSPHVVVMVGSVAVV